MHEEVLGREGLLIENLINLEQIDFSTPIISAFPLKLTDGDGSPVRAVAMGESHR